jgi:hypothetical protein
MRIFALYLSGVLKTPNASERQARSKMDVMKIVNPVNDEE